MWEESRDAQCRLASAGVSNYSKRILQRDFPSPSKNISNSIHSCRQNFDIHVHIVELSIRLNLLTHTLNFTCQSVIPVITRTHYRSCRFQSSLSASTSCQSNPLFVFEVLAEQDRGGVRFGLPWKPHQLCASLRQCSSRKQTDLKGKCAGSLQRALTTCPT